MFDYLSLNINLEMINPGQYPLITATIKVMAGTYKSQWTVSNPVNQILIQITNPDTRKKNRLSLVSLYCFTFIIFSFI